MFELPDITKKIYFIGIGGVSMSALAVIAAKRGYAVGGSDRTESKVVQQLRAQGIQVNIGHVAKQVIPYDVIVYNAAIHPDNPEYAKALEDGKCLVYRADFLASLMGSHQNAIGVAGMHGKSTTSAMLSHLFLSAGRDPDVLIGAVLPELGHAYRVGDTNRDFIFEACEYQDSFLSFMPSIAVVLNVEMDHPDYFKSMEQIRDSFHRYMSIPGETGYAVLNWDDENVRMAAAGIPTKTVTFAVNAADADYRGVHIRFCNGHGNFDIIRAGEAVPFCHISLSVSGQHNIMNALAAAAVGDLCGLTPKAIETGISSFAGAMRRMEYKGEFPGTGAKVYDDFAHHPSEVSTTINGAKKMCDGRVFVVYQPHTYSRTAELFDAFCSAFDEANTLLLVDIYAARESNTYGISSADLAARIPHAQYLPDFADVTSYLKENTVAGDMILIMGAGDISQYAQTICEKS